MSRKDSAGEKKLFAASAAYILGLSPVQEIRGSSKQIKAYKSVLTASKNLYEALRDDEATENVLYLIKEKKEKARCLYDETGIPWPF